MRKWLLLIILLLIFISGCKVSREDNSDGKYITIAIPEPNEIEQFTGPIKDYNISILKAGDIFSPKGVEFDIYGKYVLKEYDDSTINIRIVKYDEENVIENIDNIFNLFANNAESAGHKIDIVNKFNFINHTADSVRAFYHKGWFFEGGSDFFVASSIFVKKGTYIIEVSEHLNPNMKSIGQENLEKIAKLILKQNNFS